MYSIARVTALIGAHRYGKTEVQVEWLLTDSRSLTFPETTMFFALRTHEGNGHRYIDDLYRRGVRAFCVEELPKEDYSEANFLVVKSPLKALQRLAERHRDEFSCPVIGVTGSNGKTLVKEWLHALLSPDYVVTRSPRSYNSQIGVPLSVWLLNAHTQMGVFEAGVSRPGEMAALRNIIQPTIGVFTCLGPAHQEKFQSLEEKCLEKLTLFQDAETVICNIDDECVENCLKKSKLKGRLVTWTRTGKAANYQIDTAIENCTTVIRYSGDGIGGSREFTVPFINEAYVENCLICLVTGLYLGMDSDVLHTRLTQLKPVTMRLEVKEGKHGCTLINDAYNSDIAALNIALDFMVRRPELNGRGKTLVVSDILQTGVEPEELYAQVAENCSRRGIRRIIGVGRDLMQVPHLFKDFDAQFFLTTDDLMRSGVLDAIQNEVILFKGSRHFGFETLVEHLALKVHETTLEINLKALERNVKYYRQFMKPETKMVCMIKANGYGTGAEEVARTLQDCGVNYLAVAVADEGASLRRAGITSGIMVMNPEMSSFETLFRYRLEPEVYSFKILENLIAAAEKAGIQGFPVHIKLDTGMCRLGFNPHEDMPKLIERLKKQNAVVPRTVFTHFVGSDSPDFNEFSKRQFEIFDKASRELQDAFPHKILRHICNSAAIERFPERHLDMVRLGIGLYGVSPLNNGTINCVAKLKTTILQIRDVEAGTSVGYSRRTMLDRPARIAALPIGYADGLDRHLGNRHGYCLVNGHKAEYVGNICMDVCMIDVTDIPCQEGDSVEIFGSNLPVSTLSDILGTIPYEVLTGVSERVKKVYYRE